ncbi:hypothetical protein [Streptomyces sp. NPDC051909]
MTARTLTESIAQHDQDNAMAEALNGTFKADLIETQARRVGGLGKL